MVKVVKTVDACVKETKTEIPTSVVPETAQPIDVPLSELEIKRALLSQINHDKLLEMISVDKLLGAWAECHGYEKKHA